jgi:serine/threonine-protein kinase
MSEPNHERDRVEQLAEEFVRRHRAGEGPSVEAYAAAHPQHAEQIRELFPALVMMEELAPSSSGDRSSASRPVLPPPLILDERIGDYRLVRRIGAGGMGVVYEAVQESLGRCVALKLLTGMAARDSTALVRFRREARAAAQLHHTNIVPVYEVGQAGDVCFYAMQLILGQGLDAVLEDLQRLRAPGERPAVAPAVAHSLWTGHFEQPRLEGGEDSRPGSTVAHTLPGREPPPSAADGATPGDRPPASSELSSAEGNVRHYFRSVARIGRQAADALHYAHQRGVIHRDVKPSNLLLDTAGAVWVTDFGLAKTEDEALTQPGDLLGTLRYMAPERFEGACDARTDVYALGLTLYELLTLRPAFDSSDRLQLMERIIHQEPPRPRDLDPRIPRDLETVVLKAIDKDPARRYPSADELAEDLRRFAEDEPIRARSVGLAERLYRWARRNPLPAALSGALAGVFLVAFLVVTLLLVRANRLHGLAEKRRDEAEENLAEAERRKTEAERNLKEARRQQAQAEDNFAQARAAVEDYLTRVSESDLLKAPGLQPLQRDLLRSAVAFYKAFLAKRRDEPGLQGALASAYLRVGKIHQVLSDHDEANKALKEAHALYGSLLRKRGERARWRAGLAQCAMRMGRYSEARALYERLLRRDRHNATYKAELAEAFNSLANHAQTNRRDAQALALHRKALDLRRWLFEKNPDDPTALSNLGGSLNNIANLLRHPSQRQEALRLYREAARYQQLAHRLAPQAIQYGRFLAIILRNQASREAALIQHSQALKTMDRACQVADRLVGDHPAVFVVQALQAHTYLVLLQMQRARGLTKEAAQTRRQVERLLDRFAGLEHPADLYQLAKLRGLLAWTISQPPRDWEAFAAFQWKRQGDLALATLRRAVATGFRNAAQMKNDPSFATIRNRPEFARLLRVVAAPPVQLGPTVRPASLAEINERKKILATVRDLANPKSPRARTALAREHYTLGVLQMGLGHLEGAGASLARAEKMQRQLVKEDAKNAAEHRAYLGLVWVARGMLQWRARRLAEAPRWLDRGLDALAEPDKAGGPSSERTGALRASTEYAVSRLYDGVGLWEEADAHLSRALASAPGTPWDWVGLALLKRIHGDDKGYREVCRQASKHFAAKARGEDGFYLAWLAVLGPKSMKPADALAQMERHTTSGWRSTWKALALLRAGRVAEGRRAAIDAQVKMPSYAVTSVVRALAHYRAGEHAEARRWLDEATRRHVRHVQAVLEAGTLEVHDPTSKHALKEFLALHREARALILGKATAEDPWLALVRARLHLLLGQKKKYSADLAAMNRLAPRDAALWAAWGRGLAALGAHAEAEKAFARAVAVDARDSAPWLARAHYRLGRGDRKGAEADLLAAARTGVARQAFLDAGWWVAGPYPPDFRQGGPVEADPDPARPAPSGAVGQPPRVWKRVRPDDEGTVDLASVAPGKREVSAYALTYLAATTERVIRLRLGSEADRRVWLNGRLVYESSTDRRWTQWVDEVGLTLRPGMNILLVRVKCEADMRRFHARLGDHLLEKGHRAGELALWVESARAHNDFFRTRQANQWWRVGWGLALLAAGDRAGYRRVAGDLAKSYGGTTNGWIALELLGCLLATPDPGVQPVVLARLVARGEKGSASYPKLKRLHQYRSGAYDACLQSQGDAGDVHWLVSALAAHKLGKADEARRWLARAEQWYSQTVRSYLADGPFRLPNHWTEFALFHLLHAEARSAVLGDAASWHAPALRGRGLAELSRHKEAVAEYTRALKLARDEPRLLLARARSHTALKEWARAADDLEQARKAVKDEADFYWAEGRLALAQGKLDPAARSYARVLELASGPDPAQAREYVFLEAAQQPELFTRLHKLRPRDHALWLARARYRARLARWQKAAEDYAGWSRAHAGLVPAGSYDPTLEHAAACLLSSDTKRFRLLHAAFSKRTLARDDFWSAYCGAYTGGLAEQPPGEARRLVAWAEQAVARNRKSGAAHFVLSLALHRAGRHKEAVAHAEEGLRLEPGWNGQGLYHAALALALQAQGEKSKARAALARLEDWLSITAYAAPAAAKRPDPGVHPADWLAAHVLHREAKEKIGR